MDQPHESIVRGLINHNVYLSALPLEIQYQIFLHTGLFNGMNGYDGGRIECWHGRHQLKYNKYIDRTACTVCGLQYHGDKTNE